MPSVQSGPPPASGRDSDDLPSAGDLWRMGGGALQMGALTGTVGMIVGGAAGILRRDPRPVIFALATGIDWSILGSTYTASRSLLSHAWGGDEKMTSFDKVEASAVSGGVAGMCIGMARGPRSILPSMLVWSTLGGGVTWASLGWRNKLEKSKDAPKKAGWWEKYSPMKRLTDQEYRELLEEKILKLDAEIAIIDDAIAEAKALSASRAAEAQKKATSKEAPEQKNSSR